MHFRPVHADELDLFIETAIPASSMRSEWGFVV
jgi:hypothetical protein